MREVVAWVVAVLLHEQACSQVHEVSAMQARVLCDWRQVCGLVVYISKLLGFRRNFSFQCDRLRIRVVSSYHRPSDWLM